MDSHSVQSTSSMLGAAEAGGSSTCTLNSSQASGSRDAPYLPTSSSSLLDITLPFKASASWLRHVCSEGFLLFRLAIRLYTYLGVGWKWAMQLYRLIIYAILLLPGFIQMIIFYYLSPRVIRSIAYGTQPRQRLDLYLPKDLQPYQRYPVVIYATGGAWTIGYKAWGALLARRLSRHGVVVACLDYRNFPQGNAVQMLEDINTGIAWVCERIGKYHGDPDSITLVGQSAGAHLSCLALLKQAQQCTTSDKLPGARPAWSPRDLRAYVGVSGAFDLQALAEHLHRRGLYKGLFEQIMSLDGRPAYDELSPLEAARRLAPEAARQLPEVLLMHGTADKSVPHEGSVLLNKALKAAGAASSVRLFPGKTHTSFLLEDPMRGGRDVLMDMVLGAVTGREEEHVYTTLCPGLLCDLAGWVCPF